MNIENKQIQLFWKTLAKHQNFLADCYRCLVFQSTLEREKARFRNCQCGNSYISKLAEHPAMTNWQEFMVKL